MKIETLSLSMGVYVLSPKRFEDDRGYFSETYRKSMLEEIGMDCEFVQDNHSFSKLKGTVRGLHFQTEPQAQVKLIRVISGVAYDVVVDIRKNSPTFGQHVAIELSAENGKQLIVPEGFAHGFCTLTDNTEILYKVSSYYSKEHDTGIRWNDPEIGIPWPVNKDDAILSEKDKSLPFFSAI